MKTAYCVKQLRQDQRNPSIIALTGMRSNSLKGVNHMTICPIALAVGCEKCPAFKLCPLTYVLGDQQEEDEIDSSNKVWEESFPTADEHLDKIEEELEKNKKEESEKE